MKFKLTGSYKSADALRARLEELSLDVFLDDQLEGARGPLGQSIEWAEGKTASNRFAIHPMEGWDATTDGTPTCLLYTSPSPRDQRGSRMPSSA